MFKFPVDSVVSRFYCIMKARLKAVNCNEKHTVQCDVRCTAWDRD